MNRLATLCSGAALLLALACGGGGGGTPATPATKLTYAFPGPADGWRLVENPASTGTRKVLDLKGPAGASGNGFTFTLAVNPAKAAWVQMDSAEWATQTVFVAPDHTPKVWRARPDADRRAMHLVVGQALAAPVAYGTDALATVTLDLAAGATVGEVGLTVSQAGNLGTDPVPATIAVAVGTLTAE